MNNLYQQFQILNNQTSNAQNYLQMLQNIQSDHDFNKKVTNALGGTIVAFNMMLLIGNVVLNTCGEKLAKDMALVAATNKYKAAVLPLIHKVYNDTGSSGTRLNSYKDIGDKLGTAKDVINGVLKSKKLLELIPVVNVFVGLHQDMLAVLESLNNYQNGSKEMNEQSLTLQKLIDKTRVSIVLLGMQSADIFDKMKYGV